MAAESFKLMTGLDIQHIPYKGSPANMVALANGDSHAAVDVMTFMLPHIASGRVRPIAATTLEPPLGNCAHFHTGIDIATASGTPIRAAGAGKVIYAGRSPYDPAWIVIIAHSGALQTWYGHLDNRAHPIPVRTGDWVTKGQVIGYEGMTGRTTGPHLHFMVELNDRFVNPRLFM